LTQDEHGSRPRFRRRSTPEPIPPDPESLFGELPRGPRAVGPLWSHQADLLRDYSGTHFTSPDVAFELPTGSGKTLVGLLIAEWRRRRMRHRVVYACPTKQLARQVADAARDQNIPVVLLIGSSRQWPQSDLAQYASSKAVAVTVYSHVFNTNPQLDDAQTLLFDDAHAAENYVADAWALSIQRTHSTYADLLDALRGDLDPHLVARMVGKSPDPGGDPEVRLLPAAVIDRKIQDIDRVLSTGLSSTEDAVYRFEMIRPGLRACLFYLARSGWYIRPMIPPTFDHAPFTDPEQRLYLSATLGEAGELERAFGREKIERIKVPPAWERTGAGRRFFVFQDLATSGGDDSETAGGLIGRLLDLAAKRLILTPDDSTANRIADELKVPSQERFTA
jgi:DEAD/DEAH box helicase